MIRLDIINILNIDEVSLKIVKIVKEGAMASRTKEEASIFSTKRFILRIYRQSIRCMALDRKGDFPERIVGLLIPRLDFLQEVFELLLVFR